MTLRPFCRAITVRDDIDITCHRMLGHSGPHVSRTWRVDLRRNGIDAVRWYTTVEHTGPRSVERAS